MDGSVNELLGRLLDEDEALLAGFGLERLTIAGQLIEPATFPWEERLTIQGSGESCFATRRSIADASGEEIGEYSSPQSREVVLNLLRLLREADLDELPLFEIDPIDLRVRLTLVGAGSHHLFVIGVQDPELLEPLQPLLQEMDRLALEVRKRPVATLGVDLEMPLTVRAGEHQLALTLGFRNSGDVGLWVTHPGAMEEAPETDRCALLHFYREELEPDVTPVFPPIAAAPLTPAEGEHGTLLWVAGGSEVSLELTALVNFPDPGTYLTRVVHSCYSGGDTIGGRRRLRGCVFSNELAIEVE